MPSCVPKSKIARMLGWESAATAFASRSNRASVSASAATDSGKTLIATSLSSFLSRALYTSPIPPAPRGAKTSYGPSREPAFRDTLAEIIGRSLPYPRSGRVPFGYLRGERGGRWEGNGPSARFCFSASHLRFVGSALRYRVVEVIPGDDVVPVEDGPRPMARDLHCNALGNSRPDHVANGRAAYRQAAFLDW